MIRLTLKFLPYGLCAIGAIQVIAAISTLSGDTPEHPAVHASEDIASIDPGSEPMTKSEAPVAICSGIAFAAAGLFWLRRRRRSASIEASAFAGMRAGIAGAASRVAQEGAGRAFAKAKLPLLLACAALPWIVAASDAAEPTKPATRADSLPTEMRVWRKLAQRVDRTFRARMVDVEINEGGVSITLEDEKGVKNVYPAKYFFGESDSYFAPFLRNARRVGEQFPSSFTPTLNGEMRLWTEMTLPVETRFRAQLVDAEIRGNRPYIILRSENGEVKWYSGTRFFQKDEEYLKPFLANARRVADPVEEAKKAAALAAEKAAEEKRGYPKTADPQWSPEKRAAYDAIIAADAALKNVNDQISEIQQSQLTRRESIRSAHERYSAQMAAESGISGLAGPPPQLPGVQAPPHLIARSTALTQRCEDAVRAFRALTGTPESNTENGPPPAPQRPPNSENQVR